MGDADDVVMRAVGFDDNKTLNAFPLPAPKLAPFLPPQTDTTPATTPNPLQLGRRNASTRRKKSVENAPNPKKLRGLALPAQQPDTKTPASDVNTFARPRPLKRQSRLEVAAETTSEPQRQGQRRRRSTKRRVYEAKVVNSIPGTANVYDEGDRVIGTTTQTSVTQTRPSASGLDEETVQAAQSIVAADANRASTKYNERAKLVLTSFRQAVEKPTGVFVFPLPLDLASIRNGTPFPDIDSLTEQLLNRVMSIVLAFNAEKAGVTIFTPYMPEGLWLSALNSPQLLEDAKLELKNRPGGAIALLDDIADIAKLFAAQTQGREEKQKVVLSLTAILTMSYFSTFDPTTGGFIAKWVQAAIPYAQAYENHKRNDYDADKYGMKTNSSLLTLGAGGDASAKLELGARMVTSLQNPSQFYHFAEFTRSGESKATVYNSMPMTQASFDAFGQTPISLLGSGLVTAQNLENITQNVEQSLQQTKARATEAEGRVTTLQNNLSAAIRVSALLKTHATDEAKRLQEAITLAQSSLQTSLDYYTLLTEKVFGEEFSSIALESKDKLTAPVDTEKFITRGNAQLQVPREDITPDNVTNWKTLLDSWASRKFSWSTTFETFISDASQIASFYGNDFTDKQTTLGEAKTALIPTLQSTSNFVSQQKDRISQLEDDLQTASDNKVDPSIERDAGQWKTFVGALTEKNNQFITATNLAKSAQLAMDIAAEFKETLPSTYLDNQQLTTAGNIVAAATIGVQAGFNTSLSNDARVTLLGSVRSRLAFGDAAIAFCGTNVPRWQRGSDWSFAQSYILPKISTYGNLETQVGGYRATFTTLATTLDVTIQATRNYQTASDALVKGAQDRMSEVRRLRALQTSLKVEMSFQAVNETTIIQEEAKWRIQAINTIYAFAGDQKQVVNKAKFYNAWERVKAPYEGYIAQILTPLQQDRSVTQSLRVTARDSSVFRSQLTAFLARSKQAKDLAALSRQVDGLPVVFPYDPAQSKLFNVNTFLTSVATDWRKELAAVLGKPEAQVPTTIQAVSEMISQLNGLSTRIGTLQSQAQTLQAVARALNSDYTKMKGSEAKVVSAFLKSNLQAYEDALGNIRTALGDNVTEDSLLFVSQAAVTAAVQKLVKEKLDAFKKQVPETKEEPSRDTPDVTTVETEQTVTQLRELLNGVRAELDKQSKRVITLQSDLIKLEGEKGRVDAAYAILSNRVKADQKVREETQAQTETKESTGSELLRQALEETQEQKTKSEIELLKTKADLKAAERKISTKEGDLKAATADIDKLRKTADDLRTALQELEGTSRTQQISIDSLTTQVESKDSSLRATREELKELKENILGQKSDGASEQKAATELRVQLLAQRTKLQEAESLRDLYKPAFEQQAETKVRIQRLSSELRQKTQAAKVLQSDIKARDQSLRDTETRLGNTQVQVRDLSKTLAEAKGAISNTVSLAEYTAAQARISDLETQLSQAQARAALDIASAKRQSDVRVAALNDELERAREAAKQGANKPSADLKILELKLATARDEARRWEVEAARISLESASQLETQRNSLRSQLEKARKRFKQTQLVAGEQTDAELQEQQRRIDAQAERLLDLNAQLQEAKDRETKRQTQAPAGPPGRPPRQPTNTADADRRTSPSRPATPAESKRPDQKGQADQDNGIYDRSVELTTGEFLRVRVIKKAYGLGQFANLQSTKLLSGFIKNYFGQYSTRSLVGIITALEAYVVYTHNLVNLPIWNMKSDSKSAKSRNNDIFLAAKTLATGLRYIGELRYLAVNVDKNNFGVVFPSAPVDTLLLEFTSQTQFVRDLKDINNAVNELHKSYKKRKMQQLWKRRRITVVVIVTEEATSQGLAPQRPPPALFAQEVGGVTAVKVYKDTCNRSKPLELAYVLLRCYFMRILDFNPLSFEDALISNLDLRNVAQTLLREIGGVDPTLPLTDEVKQRLSAWAFRQVSIIPHQSSTQIGEEAGYQAGGARQSIAF